MKELTFFVVDDDPYYLNILTQHLINLGAEKILQFEGGVDCLNHLNENPDVIFLDYQMETLTGYEVLNKIKRFNPNIFVIMVSAQEEIKPAIDSLKHGAFDYVQKKDNIELKIKDVTQRVIEVKDLLERSKPSFLKKIFQFL